MFINIRLGKLFRYFFIVVVILMAIIFLISIYKVFAKTCNTSNSYSSEDIIDITSNNYTNVLKSVHDNLDSYVDKKIHFTGYVYRVFDLSSTQFVLARNMIISSDNQAVVVGFLCNYNNASEFNNNSWVEVIGTITKGNYHGVIPVIEVESINNTDCPNDEFVYPPDDSFIPTNSII